MALEVFAFIVYTGVIFPMLKNGFRLTMFVRWAVGATVLLSEKL